MLRLKGVVQHYDWGRIGDDSEVARLYALSSGNEIEDKPYAELWMGTHPSGPSRVFKDDEMAPEQGMLLNDWLQEHPDALGENVLRQWRGELPFLFKVLSIAKALSIQAHPDKQLADLLYRTQPKVYKDPNHKPEMALALTNFEAICGFMSVEELKELLQAVPELRRVLREQDFLQLLNVDASQGPTDASKGALRRAFTTLMTLEKEVVAELLRALTARLTLERESRKLSAKEELVLVLEKQYPDDVGVLASLFLNYIRLKPGQAVYLAANVPHAYISGECVECMATSDNVVRAGLTPKFRDTQTLSSMLSYEQGLPDILEGDQLSPFTKRYSPPFDEFEVDVVTIPSGESSEFSAVSGPSIFLVSEGRGIVTCAQEVQPCLVQQGDMFFFPAGREFQISSLVEPDVLPSGYQSGNGDAHLPPDLRSRRNLLRLYRAGVNHRVL